MKAEFWRARRVLVTGHTGFKGAWLALWLARLGAKVSGYSLAPPTRPSLFEAAGVAGAIESSLEADVRDPEGLAAALRRSGAEVVFHLAAQSLVRRGYAEPAETFSTNVMGTINVLEAARVAAGVRAVVVVTTDKCYLNRNEGRAFREDDPLGGEDPYSASKAAAEIAVAAYRSAFFAARDAAQVASVRSGNVIGGGDWAQDRLIVDLVRAFSRNEPARIRYPGATRPWQHVLDALAGYLELAERLCGDAGGYARAWNFGPDAGGAQTVAAVADRAAALWGEGARWEREPGEHPPEAAMLQLDASLARERLGWRPRLDLAATLEWTLEWYRAWHGAGGQAAEVRARCEAQIDRYLELRAA